MTDVHEKIAKLPTMFNEIGLWADTEISRLIGYGEDEDDCYYILMFPKGPYNDPKIVWCSMVGPWVSLKCCYRRYEQLESHMTFNNCPPQENWIDNRRPTP